MRHLRLGVPSAQLNLAPHLDFADRARERSSDCEYYCRITDRQIFGKADTQNIT
jgi:hypothetical protein